MPVITNKHNLPDEVVSALTKNRYLADEEGQDKTTDYSVSALIAPVQQTVLRKRYPDCDTSDVIDRVWTLFGHIAHALLEEHGSDDSITERRFYKSTMGKTISGQIDHYKDRKITDYKTTGAYKIKKGDFDDWSKQLNLYSLLCEEAGYPVDSIRIVAIIRDWSEADLAREHEYPKAPIVVLPLVKWSKEARERFLESRIQLLLDNEGRPDRELTECTRGERWQDFAGYAITKKGNTKATKVFKEIGQILDAQAAVAELGDNYMLETRYTQPRRCLKYCNVSAACHQMKKYLEEQNGTVEES